MNLISKEVTHITFGTGRIIFMTEKRLDVHFAESIGPKAFVYPDAFGSYLQMNDSNAQAFVFEEYMKKKEQIEAEKQKLEQLCKENEEERVRAATVKAARTTAKKKREQSNRLKSSKVK
ncbi:hypothetical protein [Paenibacillus kribbensis]|uniref:hypothetical protein n=1 Tax=Paenibacillus kribbensis TaxID=172713 RepID=UPI000837DB9B|nr:hypothetical protein [Paenibacillus kribbensis]